MDSVRKYLKIASIINFSIGIISISTIIYSAFLFLFGLVLLHLSKEEEEMLKSERKGLWMAAFVLFPFNFLSSIFLFLACDKISSSQKEGNRENAPPIKIKRVIDPEVKKIDVLLKLGVGMVLISGILFATTSWDFISDATKVIFLICFGILFLGLSFFTEKKLKLYRTSFMYWILSMAFFHFSIIGTLYFGVFNQFLTFSGAGHSLAYFITFFVLAGLSAATYLKFPKSYILYITYSSILLGFVNFLLYFKLSEAIIIMVISLILLLTSALSKKESILYTYTKLLVFLMFLFILRTGNFHTIYILIDSVIIIGNLYYFIILEQNEQESIISLPIIYLLLSISIGNLELLGECAMLILFLVITIQTLLIESNTIKGTKLFKNINYGIYSFVSLLTYGISFYDNSLISFIIGILYLIINILIPKKIREEQEIEYALYLEPISIFLTILAFANLKILSFFFSPSRVFLLSTIVYCICNLLLRSSEEKKIYLYSAMIGTLIGIGYSAFEKETLEALIFLLPSIYLFWNTSKNQEETLNCKVLQVLGYLLLLYCIYNILKIVNVLDISVIISSLLFIWLILVFLLLSKNDLIKRTSCFVMVIPILDMIQYFNFNEVYSQIMESILILYIVFLLLKFACKSSESKNIIGIIGILMSISQVMDISSYFVGIYIGIIGIIVILLGYYKKELKSFFLTGILITVINIIYQLRELWGLIPFWLYLLIGGLSLIGFVTYTELAKKNKK